jgi:hypothetical protein
LPSAKHTLVETSPQAAEVTIKSITNPNSPDALIANFPKKSYCEREKYQSFEPRTLGLPSLTFWSGKFPKHYKILPLKSRKNPHTRGMGRES